MFRPVVDAGSYVFTLYALSLLGTAVAALLLNVSVVIRERGSVVSGWFSAMTLPIAWWLTGRAMSASAPDAATALAWTRASYVAVPLIPIAVLQFSFVVLGVARRWRALLIACWLFALALAHVGVATRLVVRGMARDPWGWYPRYGIAGAAFIAFVLVLAAINMAVYARAIRELPRTRQRRRLAWFAAGLGIGYLGGIDFFAAYDLPVLPLGHLAILGTVAVFAAAIRRDHLFDITPAFAAHNIVSTIPDALLVCDDEWRIRIVNDRLCELLGWSRDELLGEHLERIAGSDDLLTTLAGPPRRERETLLRTRDGATVPVTVSSSHLDDRGRLGGTVLIARDLRERKEVEEALREKEVRLRTEEAKRKAEEHFRSLIENALDVILVLDEHGNVSYASPSMRRVLGYSPRGMLGQPPFAAIHREDEPTVRATFAELRTTLGAARLDFRVLHRDGSWRYLESLARAVPRDDGGAEVIINCRDVTERRMAEIELRGSELQFRTLVESMREGIIQVDRNDVIRYVNDRACEMTAYSREELLGSPLSELVDDATSALLREKRELRARGIADEYQVAFRRKDGAQRWFEVTGSPVFDVHGYVVGSLGVLTDITARRDAEAEQTRLQQELRRRETMAAMGALVGGVAHEVRNPLFAISSTLDAFEDVYGDRAEYRAFGATMREQLDRLTEVMSDLLELGRPAPTDLQPVDIAPVVEEAVSLCANAAASAGVELRFAPREPLSVACADRRRLLQAFRNLIHNAVQFAPRGSAVEIVTERTYCADGHPWVACTVRDSGPGFRPDDVPHLFEPFFTRRRGGTGLGLSIARAVVEEHGGRIVASNRDEGGAQVWFELPVAGVNGASRT